MMKKQMMTLAATLAAAVLTIGGVHTARSAFSTDNAYVKQQTIACTLEDGTDTEITAQANADESMILLSFDYFDDTVEVTAEKNEDGTYTVTDGGFFATKGAEVAQQAAAAGNWAEN